MNDALCTAARINRTYGLQMVICPAIGGRFDVTQGVNPETGNPLRMLESATPAQLVTWLDGYEMALIGAELRAEDAKSYDFPGDKGGFDFSFDEIFGSLMEPQPVAQIESISIDSRMVAGPQGIERFTIIERVINTLYTIL